MTDGYTLERTDERAAELFYTLVRAVWEGMENKDLFSVGHMDLSWYEQHMRAPGFGVLARDEKENPAGILIAVMPDGEERNLGEDIGLPEEELPKVIHMDTSAVLPAHRGHRLEQRMLLFAEECLKGTPYVHMLCTIAPDNAASLKSAEKIGYRVITTKVKYGGYLRYVLRKDRPETQDPVRQPPAPV